MKIVLLLLLRISYLEGSDFDERLLNLYIKLFKEETAIELSNNEKDIYIIRKEYEDLKKALSDANETYIDINKIINGEDLYI